MSSSRTLINISQSLVIDEGAAYLQRYLARVIWNEENSEENKKLQKFVEVYGVPDEEDYEALAEYRKKPKPGLCSGLVTNFFKCIALDQLAQSKEHKSMPIGSLARFRELLEKIVTITSGAEIPPTELKEIRETLLQIYRYHTADNYKKQGALDKLIFLEGSSESLVRKEFMFSADLSLQQLKAILPEICKKGRMIAYGGANHQTGSYDDLYYDPGHKDAWYKTDSIEALAEDLFIKGNEGLPGNLLPFHIEVFAPVALAEEKYPTTQELFDRHKLSYNTREESSCILLASRHGNLEGIRHILSTLKAEAFGKMAAYNIKAIEARLLETTKKIEETSVYDELRRYFLSCALGTIELPIKPVMGSCGEEAVSSPVSPSNTESDSGEATSSGIYAPTSPPSSFSPFKAPSMLSETSSIGRSCDEPETISSGSHTLLPLPLGAGVPASHPYEEATSGIMASLSVAQSEKGVSSEDIEQRSRKGLEEDESSSSEKISQEAEGASHPYEETSTGIMMASLSAPPLVGSVVVASSSKRKLGAGFDPDAESEAEASLTKMTKNLFSVFRPASESSSSSSTESLLSPIKPEA